MPPQTLFDGARTIEAAGLSLNLLCRQYADQDLRSLIEEGATVHCLFLAPHGQAVAAREAEEGYPAGHLSALTEMNRQILLQRVRQRLPADARERLVGTYDQTIRVNIILVNREIAVVQPYLSTARGVESPTFLLRRRAGRQGLYVVFEQMFSWLAEQSTSDG